MTGPNGEPWAEFEAGVLEGLRSPFDTLLLNLLTYKRTFVAGDFAALATTPEAADALARIRDESLAESVATSEAIHAWQRLRTPDGPATAAAEWTRRKLLDDASRMKESSTEAVLNAAVNAPTDALRKALLELADADRRHAEVLRAILGSRGPRALRERAARAEEHVGVGAGRRQEGSLRHNVERDLGTLRRRGAEPVRFHMSDAALRHLRDEGAVDMARGLAFGLPVDVEIGWTGECYAIETRERITLAEIVTSTSGDG